MLLNFDPDKPFDLSTLRRGRVSRVEFARLKEVKHPDDLKEFKRRFFKLKTPAGWVIGDIQKAEFLMPVFPH